jgi:hypothetical protein
MNVDGLRLPLFHQRLSAFICGLIIVFDAVASSIISGAATHIAAANHTWNWIPWARGRWRDQLTVLVCRRM